MAIEIVDLPIENGGSFHSFLYVYQAGYVGCSIPLLAPEIPMTSSWNGAFHGHRLVHGSETQGDVFPNRGGEESRVLGYHLRRWDWMNWVDESVLPSGKRLHNYGKSQFSKSTISMAIFNSYVKLPEGNPIVVVDPTTIFIG